jgi:hypothetical protein
MSGKKMTSAHFDHSLDISADKFNLLKKQYRNYFVTRCARAVVERMPLDHPAIIESSNCLDAIDDYMRHEKEKQKIIETTQLLYDYMRNNSDFNTEKYYYNYSSDILCVLYAGYTFLSDYSSSFDACRCWSNFCSHFYEQKDITTEQIRYYEELLNFDNIVDKNLLGGSDE